MALSTNSTNAIDLGSLPISNYPFTLAGWFRVPDEDSLMRLMRFENSSTAAHYTLVFAGNQTDWVGAVASSTSLSIAKSTSPMGRGQWHHVVGVFESDTLRKIYLDGGSVGSSTSVQSFGSPNQFSLGNTISSDFVDVADASAINGIVSDEEIEQLALGASVLSLPCARNIIAYQDCVRRLNHPAWGPVASTSQEIVVDHPRTLLSNIGRTAVMPLRTRGPFNLDRGACQSLFSEQAELAVAGIESDNTLHYGEALS